jgi:hypothetical protein
LIAREAARFVATPTNFFIFRELDLVRVLDEPVPLETLPTVEDALAQAPKKMTPRKKKLATKMKKITPTKAGKLKA